MKITLAALATELREIATLIERVDSFEGRIAWSMMEEGLDHGQVEVSGSYRTGNSEGQGGVCVIEATKQPDPASLRERFMHYHALVKQAADAHYAAITSVSINGFSPQTCMAIGEMGGVLSKALGLMERDANDMPSREGAF